MSKAYENPFHYDPELAKTYRLARAMIPIFLNENPDTVDGLVIKLSAMMPIQQTYERIVPPITHALASFPEDIIRRIIENPKNTYPGKYDGVQIYADAKEYNANINYRNKVTELKKLQSV